MSRTDLAVYNEATGFMITSRGLCGQDLSEVEVADEAWIAAVQGGVMLPFELVQDDSFTIRVVVDEPLLPQEEAEWIGRTRHKLRVPDGKLEIIGGGPEFLWDEDVDEFTRSLDIPPGDYLAEVYTYLQGVNGWFCLSEVEPAEPIGAYFRRTRPGVPFPLWLSNECCDDPEADPGHESEWKGKQADYDAEKTDFIGFLLRLSPLHEDPAPATLEEGWIAVGQGARRPARCPLGIVAEHLQPEDQD